MYIETQNLIIRDIMPEDAQAYIDMASDGSLSDIFEECTNCSEWMADWINEARKLGVEDNHCKEYLSYTIVDKKKGIPVGNVGCSYYEDYDKIGIVYFVGSKYRKRGIASEASRAYVDYFLQHYNISEIMATVRAENIASCKTVEKMNFTLAESKMYQDINDSKEELYNFYERKRK